MSIVIGLTGPTGAGKSTASIIAANMGVKVIDCDLLARKAVERQSAGLKSLVKVFGNGILNSDGTLDRKALARIAFSSQDKTELLNNTLLPHIAELVNMEIGKTPKVLLDAPTLFESGIDKICDKTVAVLSDVNIRKKRIIERDLISEEDADLRIGAGKPDEFYAKSDYTIHNNGDTAIFQNEIQELFNNLFGGNING